jgi:hypothetical protein
MDGRGVLSVLGDLLERLDLLRSVSAIGLDALESQRPLDGHLPIAKGCVREDLGLLGLLEGKEGVADPPDVLLGQLAVLLAEVLT